MERHEGDVTLDRGIEVREVFGTSGGIRGYYGRAAKEEVEEVVDYDIGDGSITERTSTETTTHYTEFVFVPGSFAIVDNSSGVFAFDLLGRETDSLIERAEIRLNSFIEDRHDESDLWQLGFYGTGGNAEKGVVYGSGVLDDAELGSVLGISEKNQVGLDYTYAGDEVKMTVAKSGYVDVYQPSNYDSKEFVDYVADEILPYAEV
ncbi:hypothetical protein VB779_09525 [Haloarculaceae archaeon H-GB11]|nr:hypothetical protein [Haloarculaceae archaeon H-GB11]